MLDLICVNESAVDERRMSSSADLSPADVMRQMRTEGVFMKAWVKFLACCLAIAPNIAGASQTGATMITRLMMARDNGLQLFIQVAADPTRAGGHCHINETWDYVISLQDEFGKQQHAQILAAYAAQTQVHFVGSDQCDLYPYVETAVRMEML